MTKPNITIRDAHLTDAEAITALGRKTYDETFRHSVTPDDMALYLDRTYTTPIIAHELASPSHTFIVAVAPDSTVAGFAQLTQGTTEPCLDGTKNVVELQRLYVSSDYQGFGIGRKLIKRCEEIARDMGFENVWLGVWEENYPAQAVYGKCGYERIGEHNFVLGTCVQTDWVLVKAL